MTLWFSIKNCLIRVIRFENIGALHVKHSLQSKVYVILDQKLLSPAVSALHLLTTQILLNHFDKGWIFEKMHISHVFYILKIKRLIGFSIFCCWRENIINCATLIVVLIKFGLWGLIQGHGFISFRTRVFYIWEDANCSRMLSRDQTSFTCNVALNTFNT